MSLVPKESRPVLLLIDVQPRRTEARMNCPHWLLALTIPFSRSDRAHTCTADVGAGLSEGRFRTDRSAGMSPSAAGGPWEAVPTGWSTYQIRAPASTHSHEANGTWASPGPARNAHGNGDQPVPRGYPTLSGTRSRHRAPRSASASPSPPLCRSGSPVPDASVAASRRRSTGQPRAPGLSCLEPTDRCRCRPR